MCGLNTSLSLCPRPASTSPAPIAATFMLTLVGAEPQQAHPPANGLPTFANLQHLPRLRYVCRVFIGNEPQQITRVRSEAVVELKQAARCVGHQRRHGVQVQLGVGRGGLESEPWLRAWPRAGLPPSSSSAPTTLT